MDILLITPRLPYPPDQGNKFTMFNMIRLLSKNHRVTLFSLVLGDEGARYNDELKKYCHRIETVRMRPKWSVKNLLYAVCKSDPYTSIKYYSPLMMNRMRRFLKENRFDIIQVEFYYMAQYLMRLKSLIPDDTATFLDTHNVEYFMYKDFYHTVKNPFLRFFMFFELLRIKSYERFVFNHFDRCLAVSKGDIERMTGLQPEVKAVLQPHGVDAELSASYHHARPKENSIIFFGTMSFFANYDAMRFFCGAIFPLIRRSIPEVKLTIAGSSPLPDIAALDSDPAITVTGYVDDLRALIARASVIVVPLRVGGGIRIKIVEAWAMGKAIVSTTIGATGVDFSDGEDILIADKPEDFAEKTVGLLKNEELRQRLGKAGRYKAQKKYSWDVLITGLEAEYEKALKEKARA